MITHICYTCKKDLPQTAYLPSADKRKWRRCKSCINIKQKDNYAKKLIEKREYRRLQYLKNKEVINEKRKNSDSYMKHLIRSKLNTVKNDNDIITLDTVINQDLIELQKNILITERWVKENS
jgi:hypothetical protein